MSAPETILQRIKSHLAFFIIIVIIFIMDVILAVIDPMFPPWPVIETTYTLFCFSIQGCALLYIIGGFLIVRWIKTGKSNTATLCWGLAFCAYGFLLIGLIMQALHLPWADMTQPGIFFIYRNVMIIWAALMYNGIMRIITQNKKWVLYPTILILVSGYSIFIVGLSLTSIEHMMYAFLYSIWIPVCILIVYLFWMHGRMMQIKSSKILTIGFLMLTVTYVAWSSTHATYNYYIIYALFNIANTFILIGFVILPYETRIKQLESEK
nr:hypothetical protein [Candidatus Sigynarchaeota archaeon]